MDFTRKQGRPRGLPAVVLTEEIAYTRRAGTIDHFGLTAKNSCLWPHWQQYGRGDRTFQRALGRIRYGDSDHKGVVVALRGSEETLWRQARGKLRNLWRREF